MGQVPQESVIDSLLLVEHVFWLFGGIAAEDKNIGLILPDLNDSSLHGGEFVGCIQAVHLDFMFLAVADELVILGGVLLESEYKHGEYIFEVGFAPDVHGMGISFHELKGFVILLVGVVLSYNFR